MLPRVTFEDDWLWPEKQGRDGDVKGWVHRDNSLQLVGAVGVAWGSTVAAFILEHGGKLRVHTTASTGIMTESESLKTGRPIREFCGSCHPSLIGFHGRGFPVLHTDCHKTHSQ